VIRRRIFVQNRRLLLFADNFFLVGHN
jgi:hypothetical protein